MATLRLETEVHMGNVSIISDRNRPFMQTRQTLGALIADCINEKSEQIAVQWARPSGTATRHFWIGDLLPDDIC